MSLAAMQHFSRFPSIPVEALADLDAVLDWSAAKPAGQRTLSAVLAAEVCHTPTAVPCSLLRCIRLKGCTVCCACCARHLRLAVPD